MTVRLSGVRYRYRTWRRSGADVDALRGISADFRSSSIAILGRNGAGKSTLLDLLATTRRPTSGRVEAMGIDPSRSRSSAEEYRSQIGLLPQRFQAMPGYTCEELLRYVAWLKKVDSTHMQSAIEAALQAVNLSAQWDLPVGRLSGGMLQRLGLAQALVSSPRMLLLDEPTVGLDPEQRSDLLSRISSLTPHTTVILASHLVEDVALLADEVLVLDGGSVAFAGDICSFVGTGDRSQITGAQVHDAYLRSLKPAGSGV